MKKNTEPKTMTPLGAANIWPEMSLGPDWEDMPVLTGYVVTDDVPNKGTDYLIRFRQKQRAWKFIAVCLVFIVLGVIYIYIR